MNNINQALTFSFLEKYALIGLSLISNMLIARLLTPTEIGIYAVAAALIGVGQVVRDFGIGNYLIQANDLTKDHLRTAFSISFLIGGTMFLAFVLAAQPLGEFYGDERMITIIRVIALNFLLMPFCTISLSMLRRNMRFDRLMIINTFAAVVGFAVTLWLVVTGFGPQSLAWGAVAVTITTGFVAWLAQDDRRLLRPSMSKWRSIVSFGGQNTLVGILTSVAMDINDLVVGKVMGFASVAILSRAQGIMNLCHRDLMGAVRNVAYPAFAKAHRDGEVLESRFVASVTAVTVFAWPFYSFIALYPLEVLRLLFGPQWDAAARLVPVFAVAGAFSAVFSLVPQIIMAVGRVDLVTRAELVIQSLRVILVVVAVVIFKTEMACALAFLFAFAIAMPLFFVFKSRCVKNNFCDLMSGLLKSLYVTIATLSVGSLFVLSAGFNRSSPMHLGVFLFICLATLITWLGAISLFRHPISLHPLFRQLASYFPKLY